MTERVYRFIIGIAIIVFLFFQFNYAIWALLALFAFEGLTNLRATIIVSNILYSGKNIKITDGENSNHTHNYEAERMLRWIILLLILLGTLEYTNQILWFFPWFVGLMLLLAGITGICPMVMALRKLGLK